MNLRNKKYKILKKEEQTNGCSGCFFFKKRECLADKNPEFPCETKILKLVKLK